MRRALCGSVAAATLIVLSAGVSVAGAVSGPGANSNSKFVYTEEIVYPAGTAGAGDLLVTIEEGGQKRFMSVDYRLDAHVIAVSGCGCSPQTIAVQYFASQTVTAVPDESGRAAGSFALEVQSAGGTLGESLRRIEYADVTLTNLTTGHVYRLESISQDYAS